MAKKPTSSPASAAAAVLDDGARSKAVEAVLEVLYGLGMTKRKATMGLENTIFAVAASGGHVRANLARSRPEDVLADIFDAVWSAGVIRGRTLQESEQTEVLLEAFPSLRDVMRGVAEEAIKTDRAVRGED